MCEIKFRAWNNVSKGMKTNQQTIELMAEGNPYGYSIMQYTGLKDKNGVEIYCKDIVKDFFSEKIYLLGETLIDCAIQGLYNESPQRLLVIGNIYEHPHLLGGE